MNDKNLPGLSMRCGEGEVGVSGVGEAGRWTFFISYVAYDSSSGKRLIFADCNSTLTKLMADDGFS